MSNPKENGDMSNSNDNEEIARLKKENETFRKKEVRRLLEAHSTKFLKDENYVLPDAPEIKQNYLDIMFDKMEDEDTKLDIQDGKLVVLNAEGYPKENEQGRDITLDDHLKSIAPKFFPKAQSRPKEMYPEKRDHTNMPEIRTAEDYYRALDAAKTREQKRALTDRLPELKAKGIIGKKEDPKQKIREAYYAELDAASNSPDALRAIKERYKTLLAE